MNDALSIVRISAGDAAAIIAERAATGIGPMRNVFAMTETSTTNDRTPFPFYLFGFAGRIGLAQYFIGLAVAIAVLLAAFALVGSAMASTGGGGGAVLAIPLFIVFLWIVLAVMIQRLRDAGKRPALSILFILGALTMLLLGMEFIEYAGVLFALIFLGLIAAPGFLTQKRSDEVAAPQ